MGCSVAIILLFTASLYFVTARPSANDWPDLPLPNPLLGHQVDNDGSDDDRVDYSDSVPGGKEMSSTTPPEPSTVLSTTQPPFGTMSSEDTDFLENWDTSDTDPEEDVPNLETWRWVMARSLFREMVWPLLVFVMFIFVMLTLWGVCCCKKGALFCCGFPLCDISPEATHNYTQERKRKDSVRLHKRNTSTYAVAYSDMAPLPRGGSLEDDFPAPPSVGATVEAIIHEEPVPLGSQTPSSARTVIEKK